IPLTTNSGAVILVYEIWFSTYQKTPVKVLTATRNKSRLCRSSRFVGYHCVRVPAIDPISRHVERQVTKDVIFHPYHQVQRAPLQRGSCACSVQQAYLGYVQYLRHVD